MLRKFIIAAIFLGMAFTVLSVSVFQTIVQANTNFKVSQVASIAPTPTESKVSNYYLVYPGLLPDHLLYPIKMARDKVILFFTFDPLKKAELSLLFADKRLGAGKALAEGGKSELAVSTLSKGEIYLEQAVNFAEEAEKKGKDTKEFYEKLQQASIKHQEILEGIGKILPEQGRSSIGEILNYAKNAYSAATK